MMEKTMPKTENQETVPAANCQYVLKRKRSTDGKVSRLSTPVGHCLFTNLWLQKLVLEVVTPAA